MPALLLALVVFVQLCPAVSNYISYLERPPGSFAPGAAPSVYVRDDEWGVLGNVGVYTAPRTKTSHDAKRSEFVISVAFFATNFGANLGEVFLLRQGL